MVSIWLVVIMDIIILIKVNRPGVIIGRMLEMLILMPQLDLMVMEIPMLVLDQTNLSLELEDPIELLLVLNIELKEINGEILGPPKEIIVVTLMPGDLLGVIEMLLKLEEELDLMVTEDLELIQEKEIQMPSVKVNMDLILKQE